MKTNNSIETHGSITKNESLTQIDYNILKNTLVAESGDPYANYYGNVPHRLPPNSLFLFTKQFYPLDDVVKITCEIEEFFGYTKKLDIATAILDFTDHYHYALRVKDFPDYKHIHWLQSCYRSEEITFCHKVHLTKPVRVTVFKQLILDKQEEGIYLDYTNAHKGYITIPRQINNNEFSELLINLRNNNDCELFDAAIGSIEINSETKNMIRIYSENIKIELLKCIKEKFSSALLK